MNTPQHTLIKLTGCAPTPLAAYLKALGILRLVSEQADPTARGFWQNESFVLSTVLSEEELAEFFLCQYAPTPIVDPWNGGSGFLKNDKSAAFLAKFEQSSAPRLARYQVGAKAARDLCHALSEAKLAEVAIKEESKALPAQQRDALRNDPVYKARLAEASRKIKRLKESFISECRLKWRGSHLEWLDAAVILDADMAPKYPSMLGSGGNDGNLDFTDNFRQRFLDLFDIEQPDSPAHKCTRDLLVHALYGSAVVGTGGYSIGQYAPGAAGGANSSNGLDGKANVNPWDFILFLEGAVLFSAATTRRLGASDISSVSAPFALRADSVGHHSSSAKEKTTRGEQWMPLWDRPASLREIRSLLSEGRAQLGRIPAREPVSMARAIARLGVARGIIAFERFGYIERNGQSTFAVPLGRWKVVAQPHQELLSDLDAYLRRISREASSERATASLVTVARRLNDAVLAVAANGAAPSNWQNILVVLSMADALAATIPPDKNKFGIVPKLQPTWLAAADDNSPEFRLAVAFASQQGIRRYFLPLNKFGNKLDQTGSASVVCFGRDFMSDAIAFLNRRLIESSQNATGAFVQSAAVPASLSDIAVFLQGVLDVSRIMSLSRALMAIDYNALSSANPLSSSPRFEGIDDAFALFRFSIAPRHWKTGIPVRADIFRRLASGDLSSATRFAASHLRAHGVIPPISLSVGNADLVAASLAFPLRAAARDTLQQSFIV